MQRETARRRRRIDLIDRVIFNYFVFVLFLFRFEFQKINIKSGERLNSDLRRMRRRRYPPISPVSPILISIDFFLR